MSDLFEAAFEHAGVGMALISPEGRFLRANVALQELLGLTEAELLAVDVQSITHPEDLDADLALLAKLSAGAICSYRLDKRFLRSDGSFVPTHLTVAAARHPDGSVRCYMSQIQDITARIEAERGRARSEAHFRLMAEHSSDMIVTSRIDGTITSITPACRRISGHEPEELIGLRAVEVAHPDDLVGLLRGFGGLLRGEAASSIRWRVRHKSEDRWVWLESRPALLPPGDETGAVFVDVVRDVTDQVTQEAALSDARRAADAAASAKSEFLANVSHEIRTPLTAVVGFAELLAERKLDIVSHSYVGRIETAGRALLALVNDILNYSRMEAGHVNIAPRRTQPGDVLDEVNDILGPAAEAKGLKLTMVLSAAPEAVEVDADRLRQVILNLGSNAIKFTERGEVTVGVGWDATDSSLTVAVRDTGIGLTSDQRGRLFKRFSQVGPGANRRQGTGLGLAICRTLVEAMGGGRIEVTSRPGEGSCFAFRIPAPAARAAIEQAPPSLPSMLAGVRVMVVDDNESNRRLARAVLESQGAEIAEAVDGLAAVELARCSPCDVIVMDVRMPELDGLGALHRIRSEPGPNRHTPILAFTAGAADETLNGFDDIVPKPLLADALLRTVRRAVGGGVA